jgi:hypothetical protein
MMQPIRLSSSEAERVLGLIQERIDQLDSLENLFRGMKHADTLSIEDGIELDTLIRYIEFLKDYIMQRKNELNQAIHS